MKKPSVQEEEYFAKKEAERRLKQEAEKQAEIQKEERTRLRKLHHMHCPKCGMHLIEIDYKGIKVDECSECKGVWLDAKELDQVVALEQPAVKKLLKFFST